MARVDPAGPVTDMDRFRAEIRALLAGYRTGVAVPVIDEPETVERHAHKPPLRKRRNRRPTVDGEDLAPETKAASPE